MSGRIVYIVEDIIIFFYQFLKRFTASDVKFLVPTKVFDENILYRLFLDVAFHIWVI